MDNPSVSCLIITYAPTREVLDECLESLSSQTHKPDRILIADNKSETSEIVSSLPGDEIVILMLPANLGFAGAINRALSEIDTDFVLIMNFDVILESNFIEEALKGFTDEKIMCVTGKTLFMNDRKVIDNTGTLVNGHLSAYNRGVGQIDIGQYDFPDQPMGACFAAALIRRKAFEPKFVGPMDDNYFLYYEDVDWCYRMNIYGYRCSYVPTAVMYHHHSLTTRDKDVAFKYYYIQRNLLYTIVKNMKLITMIKLLLFHYRHHRMRAKVEDEFREVTARIYKSFWAAFPRLFFQRQVIQLRRKVSDTDVVNLSINERGHLDDVKLIPQITWENLRDMFARLGKFGENTKASRLSDVLELTSRYEEINPAQAFEITALFKDEDERVKDMVNHLVKKHTVADR